MGDRYIKVLAQLEFGKASRGFKRMTKSKQCLQAPTTAPRETADGLTAVSQRPSVDPFSEYPSLFPKFSRSYKPCQCCLLVRGCLSRFIPLSTTSPIPVSLPNGFRFMHRIEFTGSRCWVGRS